MVRENFWEMIFFLVRGKSGKFVDGQVNLERLGLSGNLKINGYCSQENILILLMSKECTFQRAGPGT